MSLLQEYIKVVKKHPCLERVLIFMDNATNTNEVSLTAQETVAANMDLQKPVLSEGYSEKYGLVLIRIVMDAVDPV